MTSREKGAGFGKRESIKMKNYLILLDFMVLHGIIKWIYKWSNKGFAI